MSSEPSCVDRRQLPSSSSGGTAAGLSDRLLLATFVHRRGEAAEAAFEVLVRRHGPMVLRLCRRVLEDESDVEDAFQATFLVLACRAQAISGSEALEGWLFGVARRVADGARKQDATAADCGSVAEPCWGELHREIDRLPGRYRVPIVLCDLEGIAAEEAAGRLRWPVGKLEGRLLRARRRLRSRLARKGMASSAALLTGPGLPPLPLPETLAESAVAIVRGTTAIAPAVAVASSDEVASLAHPVLRALGVARLRATACVLLAAGAVLLGAGVGARRLLVDRPVVAGGPVSGDVKCGTAGAGDCPDASVGPERSAPIEVPVAE